LTHDKPAAIFQRSTVMTGLGQALDHGAAYLVSPPEDARSIDPPDAATLEDGLPSRVHDSDGYILLTATPTAIAGDSIPPTHSVKPRRRPTEAAAAAGGGSIWGRVRAAFRVWADAGQLAPYHDTRTTGRYTGARC
jgi:hypothetical protein